MWRGGEVEVDVPVTKNSSHPLSSGGMIAAGNKGESEATHGGADDDKPAASAYAISAMILIEELEEEVAMRKFTLGSLASKLERQRKKYQRRNKRRRCCGMGCNVWRSKD